MTSNRATGLLNAFLSGFLITNGVETNRTWVLAVGIVCGIVAVISFILDVM